MLAQMLIAAAAELDFWGTRRDWPGTRQVLRALDTVEDDMEAYKGWGLHGRTFCLPGFWPAKVFCGRVPALGRESEKQKELISFGDKRLVYCPYLTHPRSSNQVGPLNLSECQADGSQLQHKRRLQNAEYADPVCVNLCLRRRWRSRRAHAH